MIISKRYYGFLHHEFDYDVNYLQEINQKQLFLVIASDVKNNDDKHVIKCMI